MTDRTEQGVCEVIVGVSDDQHCGKPAVLRYPAIGGGYMRLCDDHGVKHLSYCEQWTGKAWEAHKTVPADAR